MIKGIIFNDPHYARREPECRTPEYPREILGKFRQIGRIAKKTQCQIIGCTGDWYHRKGKVRFSEANDILALLSGWHANGLEAVGILGNHDIPGHKLDALDDRAVGAMVHSKLLRLLDVDPFEMKKGKAKVVIEGEGSPVTR